MDGSYSEQTHTRYGIKQSSTNGIDLFCGRMKICFPHDFPSEFDFGKINVN